MNNVSKNVIVATGRVGVLKYVQHQLALLPRGTLSFDKNSPVSRQAITAIKNKSGRYKVNPTLNSLDGICDLLGDGYEIAVIKHADAASD